MLWWLWWPILIICYTYDWLVLRMIREPNVEDHFLCHALHNFQTLVLCWFHVSFVSTHSKSSMTDFSHDLWLIETYEIEDHFPYFDPYAWWIPCCFVSRLRGVHQNLSMPWSFEARRIGWCWFLSLGELGFQSLTSLVSCPRCLVFTVDIPSNKVANCVFRHNSKRAMKWNCERPK